MYKILFLLVIYISCLISNAADSLYDRVSIHLGKQVKNENIHISVGDFIYADTKMMSKFSALLRDELCSALAKSPKFKIISRERLSDLLKEQRLQNSDLFDPSSKKINIKIKGIEGIIRGRFYYRYPQITVFVELIRLNGGEIKTTKMVINADTISTDILPANLAKSKKNIIDIRDRIKKVPHNFKITLNTVGTKRNFKSGDKVQFKVRADKDCYIAVFCHQVDGSTVLLFPNSLDKDTLVKANSVILIPKAKNKKFNIEVCPPFGSDVVQVIASTQKSILHRKVEQLVKRPAKTRYRDLTRGLFSKAITESIDDKSLNDASDSAQWSESHIIISTYQK